jgi:hypothetical protein
MIGRVDISAMVGNQRHPVDQDDQVEIDAMTAITFSSWTLEALMRDQTPGISSAVVFDDRRAGWQTQQRLREFRRQGGRILLCHDVEDERS